MTKFLLLLSAAVMAMACYFSWQNRETFVKVRKDRQKIDVAIKKDLGAATVAANEVGAIKADVTAISGELESEKTRLEQAQIKLRNIKADADRAAADLATANKDMEAITAKFVEMPPGVTPETIGDSVNKQKTTIAENEDKAKQMQEAVANKEKELKRSTDELADIQKRVTDRRKFYDRNSLSATIVAVNNEWGFVVIDAGKNKEITADTKLLITRGNDTIGKLNIVSVDGTKTVANIDRKSVRRGVSVSPGDRVILETLYQ